MRFTALRIVQNEFTVRVIPFSTDECAAAPTSGPPLFTWREFHTFRNSLLQVLKDYGSVGPMGEMPILEDWEASESAWEVAESDPDFFVVDDMWNQWSRWNRVEAAPWLVTADLLVDVTQMLSAFPEWCVYFALTEGGLTVFHDRILFEGALFSGASSIDDLSRRGESTKSERNRQPDSGDVA